MNRLDAIKFLLVCLHKTKFEFLSTPYLFPSLIAKMLVSLKTLQDSKEDNCYREYNLDI